MSSQCLTVTLNNNKTTIKFFLKKTQQFKNEKRKKFKKKENQFRKISCTKKLHAELEEVANSQHSVPTR